MVRLLHTADLHLGAPFVFLGDNAPKRRQDQLRTWERLVETAIRQRVHLFVVAGDLFDQSQPDKELVARVQSQLQRLLHQGIVPVLLPGTHDHMGFGEGVYAQALAAGCVQLTEPCQSEPLQVQAGGETVYLYGLSYQGQDLEQACRAMQRRWAEGWHIGLVHGSWQQSASQPLRDKDVPFTREQLLEWQLDYVALGQYHNFQSLTDEAGRLRACYPGSPEGRRFGENGARYAAVVTLEGDAAQVQAVSVATRRLEEGQLDLSGCADLEAAVAAVERWADPELLLRLELTGVLETPLDIEVIEQRQLDNFAYLELVDRTSLCTAHWVSQLSQEDTVRGEVVRQARQALSGASAEQKPVLEEALRLVLSRCQGDAEPC